MKYFTLVLASSFLMGCAGVFVSTGSKITVESVSNNSRYVAKSGATMEWASTAHPSNGVMLVDTESKWCGFTLWAIIPVPLELPVCNAYTEINFSKNVAIDVIKHEPQTYYALCGPGVWYMHAAYSNHGANWCESGNL